MRATPAPDRRILHVDKKKNEAFVTEGIKCFFFLSPRLLFARCPPSYTFVRAEAILGGFLEEETLCALAARNAEFYEISGFDGYGSKFGFLRVPRSRIF